jgi:hypothetical protein
MIYVIITEVLLHYFCAINYSIELWQPWQKYRQT